MEVLTTSLALTVTKAVTELGEKLVSELRGTEAGAGSNEA